MGGAHLAALVEPLRDRHADHVDLSGDDWRRVQADRLGERRQPDPRRERRGLVEDVDDVRLPLAPEVLEHPRLDHVDHVAVAVVVVADVFLVEPRQPRPLVRRVGVLHQPLAHHLHPIRVHRRPQHHDVVGQDLLDDRIARPAEQVVGQLRRHLGAGHLGGVAAAVDVDEGASLARERPRLGVGQVLGVGQALSNLAQAVELREVGRGRDQREVHRPALRRLPRFNQLGSSGSQPRASSDR